MDLACIKCGEQTTVSIDGVIGRYRCTECGHEAMAIFEPLQEFRDDPFTNIYAVFAPQGGKTVDLVRLRQMLPSIQDRSLADLMEEIKRVGRIGIGVMRVSGVEELAKRIAEQGLKIDLIT